MESYTLGRLAHSIGAECPKGCAAQIATGVSTDTRTLAPGDVFFALSGESFDGSVFVAEAFRRGACAAVVAGEQPSAKALGPTLRVTSVRRALLELGQRRHGRVRRQAAPAEDVRAAHRGAAQRAARAWSVSGLG